MDSVHLRHVTGGNPLLMFHHLSTVFEGILLVSPWIFFRVQMTGVGLFESTGIDHRNDS